MQNEEKNMREEEEDRGGQAKKVIPGRVHSIEHSSCKQQPEQSERECWMNRTMTATKKVKRKSIRWK